MSKKKPQQKKVEFDHKQAVQEALEWLGYGVLDVTVKESRAPRHIIQWSATIGHERPGNDEIHKQELNGAYTVHMANVERTVKISVITQIGWEGHRHRDFLDQVLAWCERYFYAEPERNRLVEYALRDCLNTAASMGISKQNFEEWYMTFVNFRNNLNEFYARVTPGTDERPVIRKRHKSNRNLTGNKLRN